MIIAFPIELRDPIEESIIHLHFGRAQHFALLDTVSQEIKIIKNESNHFGGTLLPPHFLHSKGVNMIVAKHMGGSAYANFQSLGIQVMTTPNDIHVLKDVIAQKEKWIHAENAPEMIDGLKQDGHGHHHHEH